jgi:hypothetical protein
MLDAASGAEGTAGENAASGAESGKVSGGEGIKSGSGDENSEEEGGKKEDTTACRKLDMLVTNHDTTDCLLSTTFQRTAYLDVQLYQSSLKFQRTFELQYTVTRYLDVQLYRSSLKYCFNVSFKFELAIIGKAAAGIY